MSEKITFTPIGIIHSSFTELAGMPIQPAGEKSAPGTIEIFPEYSAGLKDLDGFSHIYLIFYLHQSHFSDLTVAPFLDDQPHGVFATRAPNRPNPIGLSLVKLDRVEDNILTVENLDILDGTPLLDIKPYVALFEETADLRVGWLEGNLDKIREKTSDGRFTE
jgi:tRNA-Thr(GGU) m(6)t(6)A37 methyltransferase TsaA